MPGRDISNLLGGAQYTTQAASAKNATKGNSLNLDLMVCADN